MGRASREVPTDLRSRSIAGSYRIFSKYRLLARLGSGGMAEVFLAVTGGTSGFTKLQVLKVLRSDLPEQERADFARMFQDEARLAARLSHPNIVQSHEVGREEGHDFIAMEYLDGQPLSELQDRAWARDPSFTLEMQLQVLCWVLEGLEYAHGLTDYDGRELHIVHRDVSPQNVFILYSGHTKLVDFGIAKTLESHKTRAGVVKGKVPYMSPEQVLGGGIDHRADLFSVGVMLWEAVARRHMHGTASVYEILRSLVQGDLPNIRHAAPDVPRQLEQILARALALKPSDRYPTARAFRDDLAEFLDTRRRVGAREIGECVSRLFAHERNEINDVIRQAMTQAEREELDSGQINAVHLLPTLRFLAEKSGVVGQDTTPTVTPFSPRPSQPGTAPPVQVAVAAPPVSSSPSPRPRWPLVVGLAGGGALLALLVGLGFVLKTSWSARSGSTPAAATAPAPTSESKIRLYVRVFPEEAVLTLDNQVLDENPYDAEHPRDGARHTLTASAPGYDSRTIPLRFNRDVDLELRLAQSAPNANAHSSPNPSAGPNIASLRPAANLGPARTLNVAPAHPRAATPPPKEKEEIYEDLPPRKTVGPKVSPLDTSEPPW
jgi:serine/threonine protein kinase